MKYEAEPHSVNVYNYTVAKVNPSVNSLPPNSRSQFGHNYVVTL